mgnify:CR=1 FL=1
MNTMSAGTYYVGDLCYVMHDCWDEVCELTLEKSTGLEGVFKLKDGRTFAMFNTAGDGTYYSEMGQRFSVDSGSIGCINIKDIRDNTSLKEILYLGEIVTFIDPFTVQSCNRTISFGNVSIHMELDDCDYCDDEEDDLW